MNAETAQLLSELAARFGTTAEHLWGVLVHQAPISGACKTAAFVVILALLERLRRGLVAAGRKVDGEYHCGEIEPVLLGWVGWSVAMMTCGIALIVESSTIVAAFLNPEYWALRQLLP